MLLKIIIRLVIIAILVCTFIIADNRIDKEFAALAQINPVPQTLEMVNQQHYAEASDYLAYFMQFDYVKSDTIAVNLLQSIEDKRNSISYQIDKITEGVLAGKSDEVGGQISAIISDFLIVGDIRDILIEGTHWFEGEEVDEFILALSSVGVVSSAASYAAGTGTPVEVGVTFIKLAKKTGKLPPWMQKRVLDGVRVMKQTKNMDIITETATPIYAIVKQAGVKDGLSIVETTGDMKSLKSGVRFAETFGKQSGVVIKIAGADALRLCDEMKHIPKGTIVLSTTYGKSGMRLLHKYGNDVFLKNIGKLKYLTRLSKMLYKGVLFDLLKWLLTQMPAWILYAVAGACGLFIANDMRKLVFKSNT